jgi:hypothetical protein
MKGEVEQWPLDEHSIDDLATDRLLLNVNKRPAGTGTAKLLGRTSEEKLVAPFVVQTRRVVSQRTKKRKLQCEHTIFN